MTVKPIIFSAPMVRAILARTKTQTRRVLKPQPNVMNGGAPLYDGRGSYSIEGGWKRIPYAPGDLLWVREKIERANGEAVGYPADGTWLPNTPWSWARASLPSIHMPRWASRLTLEVTGVKVERLQEISEEDAIAEGVQPLNGKFVGCFSVPGTGALSGSSGSECYLRFWNVLHGRGPSDTNPWVVAITFTVHKINIDELLRQREAA